MAVEASKVTDKDVEYILNDTAHKNRIDRLNKELEIAQLESRIKQTKRREPLASSSGGGSPGGDKFIIIDDLTDDEKADLLKGTRRVLFGRTINLKTNQIKKCRKRLFETKDDINWDDVVIADNKKDLKVHESYSALQHSLTKSSCYDVEVQVDVVGYGGGSLGHSHFEQKESIESETKLYLTAESLITKGELIIDEDAVQYTNKFIQELDELLGNEMKQDDMDKESKWLEFMDKYGQYYISRCEIGGAAYSSKEEIVTDNKTRNAQKQDFRASFKATVSMATMSVSGKYGNDKDESKHNNNKSSNISLNCHGSHASLCSTIDFSQWEESVNKNYKLWDVIKLLEVRPFYHLLNNKRKKLILENMPKIKHYEPKRVTQIKRYDHKQIMNIAIKNVKTECYLSVGTENGYQLKCLSKEAKTMETFISYPDNKNNTSTGIILKGYHGKWVNIAGGKWTAIYANIAEKNHEHTLLRLIDIDKSKNMYAIQVKTDKFIGTGEKGGVGESSKIPNNDQFLQWIIEVQKN